MAFSKQVSQAALEHLMKLLVEIKKQNQLKYEQQQAELSAVYDEEISEEMTSNQASAKQYRSNLGDGEVARLIPKTLRNVLTGDGVLRSSKNAKDWDADSGLSDKDTQDIVDKIDEHMTTAGEKVADDLGMDFNRTEDDDGNLEYEFSNKDGSPVTSEQREKVDSNLSQEFNQQAKSDGLSMRPQPGTSSVESAKDVSANYETTATSQAASNAATSAATSEVSSAVTATLTMGG